MSKALIWIDSVVMGTVLVVVGFSVCLVAFGAGFPSSYYVLLLGIILAGIGIALVGNGLRHRPHDETQS